MTDAPVTGVLLAGDSRAAWAAATRACCRSPANRCSSTSSSACGRRSARSCSTPMAIPRDFRVRSARRCRHHYRPRGTAGGRAGGHALVAGRSAAAALGGHRRRRRSAPPPRFGRSPAGPRRQRRRTDRDGALQRRTAPRDRPLAGGAGGGPRSPLGKGVRKVLDWSNRHGCVGVDFPPERLDDIESIPSSMPTRRRSWINCAACWRHRDHDGHVQAPRYRHRRLEKIRQDDADHTPHRGIHAPRPQGGLREARPPCLSNRCWDTDSARHRRAGAVKVAIVSASRWALVEELRGAPEPSLKEVFDAIGPCDLILVEGYKSAPIPKIEARRRGSLRQQPLAAGDPNVIAIAADHAAEGEGRPVFALDDISGLADFLVQAVGIGRMAGRS